MSFLNPSCGLFNPNGINAPILHACFVQQLLVKGGWNVDVTSNKENSDKPISNCIEIGGS